MKGDVDMSFIIPVPNNHADVAIGQHLVPRTYLKKWKHNLGRRHTKVWMYDKKDPDKGFKSVDVYDILKEDYFYDIVPGSLFIPDDALQDLFGFITDYEVTIDGKKLTALRDFANNLFDYENWEIKDKNGEIASETDKSSFWTAIKSSRYTFIEKAWARYEDNWATYIDSIEIKLREIKSGIQGVQFSLSDISMLMKYITIYEMRNRDGNGFIDTVVKEIYGLLPPEFMSCVIDEQDRTHDFLDTYEKQFLHDSKIHGLYEYLMDDSGRYKTQMDNYAKSMSVKFLITSSAHPFLTSEYPSMIICNEDGFYEHIFVATPTLLMALGKTDNVNRFFIENCSIADVEKYNRYIVNNSDIIISLDDRVDIGKLINKK